MARSGAKRAVGRSISSGAEETRQSLIKAAIEALRDVGFSGASAREIARRADCNQSLIFYHFDSVTKLLLAALDSVSEARWSKYQETVTDSHSPEDLVNAAASIFKEDLDAGYISVLVEMIVGSSSTPGLGAEVASRIAPWREFTAEAVRETLLKTPFAQLVSPDEMAHAVVALYLGLEMLAHLDGDRDPAMALFDRARNLSALMSSLI